MVRSWALAAFVAAGAIGASGSGADAAEGGRAFRGTAVGAITGGTPPTFLIVDYTGHASQLGQFTRHEEVNISDAGAISGTIHFVAAQGTLDVAVTGQVTALDGSTVAGSYLITAGTGRYTGATGTATFTGEIDGGVVSVAFEGSIDY